MSFSIAWVTPFSKHSDVSAFSRNILIELSAQIAAIGGTLTLFVNENGPTYWTSLPTALLTGNAQDREILASFDYVFLNIGNNNSNHSHINWLAIELPSIVIVHDMVMQHFLAGEIFEKYRRKDYYARLVGEYYGDAGLATVAKSQICTQSPIYAPWDSVHVVDMPLLEPFIQGAAAVIVHSSYAAQFVNAHFTGPTLRLALPWDQKSSIDDQALEIWQADTTSRRKFHVVCFGYIGRAKCLDQIIAAFAESTFLRNNTKLIIAGYPGDKDYTSELQEQVLLSDLKNKVDFEFAISDEHLLALKIQADIFVNLRYPNTESASGSIVEQMNTGKPVLVYPSGCYAEIPDDAAVFVAKDDGVPGISRALEQIIQDPAARIRIGQNGRAHVRHIGRKEYVQSLLAFLQEHGPTIRGRKQYYVGNRNQPKPMPDNNWASSLTFVRRLFANLKHPEYELAVSPFLTWNNALLLNYVVIGLFGQPEGSPFEHECRALLARLQRLDFYRIISQAKYIFLMTSPEFLPPPPLPRGDVFVLLRALGEEVAAAALYIGILGRVPHQQEIDTCAQSLAREPLEKILKEFLSSEEFQQRGASHQAADQLLEWCDQDHFSATARAVLEPQQTINSPELRHYLGAGWHPMEDGHVWSGAQVSTLLFALPDECAGADLCLSISGRTAGTARTGPRAVQATCNGSGDLKIDLPTDDWINFDLPLSPLPGAGDNFVVLFDAGSTVNLAALAINHDSRALGFCLRSIQLRRST